MTDSKSLTASVAAFTCGFELRQTPAESIRIATLGITDVIGVLMAGAREQVTQVVREAFAPNGRAAGVALLFGAHRAPPDVAALVNGCAAHALDYDDAGGHRSAVLVPAILAEGEAADASGADMLAAYIVGYEVWSELARRERGQLHERGWHPTGVYGTVAAACAIAHLTRLDTTQTAAAIGIAASCASGLVANFGSMTKPFHAGHAARHGVIAARLARHGMTASASVLEHERGFLAAVSQHGDFDAERPATLGAQWRLPIEGLSIKKYPTCYCTHRAIDSALQLAAEVLPADIEHIVARIGTTQKAILHADDPRTALEAKFSIQFGVACAFARRRVSLAEVDDQVVTDPTIRQLMSKVQVELTDEHDDLMHQYAPWDQVTVVLRSGALIKGPQARRASGHVQNPLSVEDLRAKFMECLRYGGATLDGEGLFAALQELAGQPAGWLKHVQQPQATSSASGLR